MEPYSHFPEANKVLARPEHMSDEECGVLAVWVGETEPGCGVVVSTWRMSWAERISALVHGRVWMWVSTNTGTQPPIALEATRNIFIHSKEGP
jgi:hypothetical protein